MGVDFGKSRGEDGMDIFWNHTISKRDVDLHEQLWVVQGQMG